MNKKVLKFEPNRGEKEPVTNVHCAKLILHKEFIEVNVHYEFQCMDPQTGRMIDDKVASKCIYPKNCVVPSLTVAFIIGQPEITNPVLILYGNNLQTWLHGDGVRMEEIYEEIKAWMIN